MVVVVGETTLLVVPVTSPTPLSMESEVAPVTVQESVELPPVPIVVGLAVKEVMTGPAITVTVAEAVAIAPPDPVAVRV